MATTTAAPRSGLDALASLASMMHESIVIPASGSPPTTDDDSEAMPPPPPRRRMRSASNPEGMERWEPAYSRRRVQYTIGIVEEDDADAEEELDADNGKSDEMVSGGTPSSPAVVISPESLLHRARSKLLQDMSEANLKGEKGLQTLPHSLNKYKHVYNKNGRIGIYTREERAAILSRYQSKRSRRVWNKKIRYNCRKNLADRRERVKGRFVKRKPVVDLTDPEAGFDPTPQLPYRRTRRHTIA